MKILTIVDSYPPHHFGGYELRCKDVLNGLRTRGHDVVVVTTRCPGRKCLDHPNKEMIYRVLHKKSLSSPSISSRIISDYKDMLSITKIFQDFEPDLIYLWHIGDLSNAIMPYFSNKEIPLAFDDGGLGAVSVRRHLNKDIYFTRNENDPLAKRKVKDFINSGINIISHNTLNSKWSWPRNMKLCFNSEYSKTNAQNNSVPVENSEVIHSGIDISKFQLIPRDTIRLPVRIITPGRISPEKGMMDSLHLLSKLKETNTLATLTLIGKDYSKSFYLEILKEIERLDLEKQVHVLPMVDHDNIARLYQNADICFFPSYQQYGLSRIPLEAMASGCLVITYGNEGSNEIIRNRENGYIVPEGDIDASIDIVQEVITDKRRYHNIIQNARLAIEQNHSIEAYVDKVELFLGSVAANSSQ